MNIKLDLYYIYNINMKNFTILLCIILIISIFIFYFSEDKIYESQKISPVSGEQTKIIACIQDPYFNNGFIISLTSIEELKEIQISLKNADKKYIINKEMGDFTLINNIHKREQIIKKCSYKLMNDIMKKNKTTLIDYSV